jgi:hypothetical protein
LFGLFRGLPFASLNSLLSVETFSKTDCALLIAAFDHREAFAETEPHLCGPLNWASSAEQLNS